MPAFHPHPFDLDEMARAAWEEFDRLGLETVRRQLAESIYRETKARLARAWIEHQESLKADTDRAAALAEARAANEVAKNAAESAQQSAAAAWVNVWIAMVALGASLIAVAISVVAFFSTK